MDDHSSETCDDMNIIFASLNLNGSLLNKQNLVCSELIELRYVLNQFKVKMNDVLENSTSVFDYYLPEIKNLNEDHTEDKIIHCELIVTELSVSFKSFIVISKSILDKIVPFFDQKHGSTLMTFSKKGKKLINYLENNYNHENKDDFILFLKNNKIEWMDFLISMRDSYVHFSDVSSHYLGFNFLVGKGVHKIETIKDINRPKIKVRFKGASKYIDALDYLEETYTNILYFSRDFLLYSGFDVQ